METDIEAIEAKVVEYMRKSLQDFPTTMTKGTIEKACEAAIKSIPTSHLPGMDLVSVSYNEKTSIVTFTYSEPVIIIKFTVENPKTSSEKE